MDFKSIKKQAHETGVSLDWAIEQRKGFCQAQIDHYRDLVRAEHESTHASHLERRLSTKHIEHHIKQIKFWTWELTKLNPEWNKDGKHINRETIAQAKAYPIQNILQQEARNTQVRCPWHEDNHPSATIKGNFLWCFVCNRGADTIELMMDLYEMNFKQAVTELAGRS